MNGFYKWLSSTKFQIAILAIGLIYISMEIFKASPYTAIRAIRDVAIAYFGARVAEPIVEFVVGKFGRTQRRKKKNYSPPSHGEDAEIANEPIDE